MICDNGVIREETQEELDMYARAENPELLADNEETIEILLGGDSDA